MPEIRHEPNVSPIGYIDEPTFKVGMSFCEPLDDIEIGKQYRHTRKLPTGEVLLRSAFDEGTPNDFAEDRLVMVIAKAGTYVTVADLHRDEDDGELIPGEPKPALRLTVEGLVIPEGLIDCEDRVVGLWADLGDIALGYLSETVGAKDGDMVLVERLKKKAPEPLKALEAVPPTVEEQNRYYG
jgi:hypothetical protein